MTDDTHPDHSPNLTYEPTPPDRITVAAHGPVRIALAPGEAAGTMVAALALHADPPIGELEIRLTAEQLVMLHASLDTLFTGDPYNLAAEIDRHHGIQR